ncbi:MAG TPA: NUDIX hydrolase [Bacteriovoracaceae bacterium]|nr:NUDIX hydrolase [Bacteriovoracaceae bacterium]
MQKEVYKGQIIRVTEEEMNNAIWERCFVPDGVIVFPITDEGKIVLIEEVRPHETPNIRLKPVSGILEPDLGTPLENAQREMQEEVGYRAEKLTPLLTINSSGTINSSQYFFVAENLVKDKLPNPDGEDIILAIKEFTPNELETLVWEEKLKWSVSTLGILKLLRFLKER